MADMATCDLNTLMGACMRKKEKCRHLVAACARGDLLAVQSVPDIAFDYCTHEEEKYFLRNVIKAGAPARIIEHLIYVRKIEPFPRHEPWLTPWHAAVSCHNVDAAKVLLEHMIEQTGNVKDRLLIDAVTLGNGAIMQLMLDKVDITVDEVLTDNESILHLALREHNLDAVRFLVEAGANTRALNLPGTLYRCRKLELLQYAYYVMQLDLTQRIDHIDEAWAFFRYQTRDVQLFKLQQGLISDESIGRIVAFEDYYKRERDHEFTSSEKWIYGDVTFLMKQIPRLAPWNRASLACRWSPARHALYPLWFLALVRTLHGVARAQRTRAADNATRDGWRALPDELLETVYAELAASTCPTQGIVKAFSAKRRTVLRAT